MISQSSGEYWRLALSPREASKKIFVLGTGISGSEKEGVWILDLRKEIGGGGPGLLGVEKEARNRDGRG